jgi:SAM-dependent methyltransferase
LPPETAAKYLKAPISEYYLESSGLRWYAPSDLGDGDYYATLASLYSWYYNPGSWDKLTALGLLADAGAKDVAEIGSGSGWLLGQLRDQGIGAFGVEINAQEVKRSRDQGLAVFFPEEIAAVLPKCDWLCLLQTIEHVDDPAGFLGGYIQQLDPRSLNLSAPCFESLLGHTSDPLSWPPHHATAWSERAFRTLGNIVGYRVTSTSYSPLSFQDFEEKLKREGSRKLFGLPYIPNGRLGRYMFELAKALRRPWACRGHSILVVMEKIN